MTRPFRARSPPDARKEKLKLAHRYIRVLLGARRGLYGRTLKGTLLFSVPVGVVTVTKPVVAPTGTVVEMAEPDVLTVNEVTGVPLNLTLVAPVRENAP
jgi:acyl-CoA reductase-like NAD-dependent aldehyde dehydrogenase